MLWREIKAGGKVFCSPIQELGNKTGPGRMMYSLEKRSSSTEKEKESVQNPVSDWISPFVGLHRFEDFC